MKIGNNNDNIFKIKKSDVFSNDIEIEKELSNKKTKSLGQSIFPEVTNNPAEFHEELNFTQNTSKIPEDNQTADALLKSTDVPPGLIDINYLTVDALRQKFPEEEYIIVHKEDEYSYFTTVKSKKKKNFYFIIFFIDFLGKRFEIENLDSENVKWKSAKYDENGILVSYTGADNKEYNVKHDNYKNYIVSPIHDDIKQRKNIIIPTTGEDIEKHVKLINMDNVLEILDLYSGLYESDIIDDLMSEYGMDIDKRIELVKHIKDAIVDKFKDEGIYTDDVSSEFDQELRYQKRKIGFASGRFSSKILYRLIRRYKNEFLYPDKTDTANGKIDKDFEQGMTGDCWLVACLKAFAKNDNAKKAVEDLISVDKNGNVTVTLKGVNKKYTFTQEELKGAQELSAGDMDVRAIEMAINKYMHEEIAHSNKLTYQSIGEHQDLNDGNTERTALQILFGKAKSTIYGQLIKDINFFGIKGKRSIEKMKTGEYICLVGIAPSSPSGVAIDSDGNEVEIVKKHSYSVSDVDDEYVYLDDPSETEPKSRLKMTHKAFKKTFSTIFLFDTRKLK